ncbi:hypothetical protein G3N57_02660 [Paraburkholderia sp. Se-20369]|nr:hypothetical protein [Paraburkholderia sp. Se-20369]TCW87271.1 hypothetical protein C5O80_04920 [Burkholderia sp. SRS-46]
MARFLYAGYLAFALYIIYPMVQNYLAADEACLRAASLAGAAPDLAASQARVHRSDCALQARIGAVAGRAGEIH